MKKSKHVPAIFKIYSELKLQRFMSVCEGDKIECLRKRCGKLHKLYSAVCIQSKEQDDLFMVYKCSGRWMIGAIYGKLVADRIPDNVDL